MSSLVVGILKCEGDLSHYDANALPADTVLRELVTDLQREANNDWCVEPVESEVIANGRTLYDIKLNGKSVGYFALRAFVQAYGDFALPELLAHGPEETVTGAAVDYDHQIYVIPLFGEMDDVIE